MSKYKCIIVEDEPLAAKILTGYISELPLLELRAVCPDGITAMEFLNQEHIDLLFLDLHLPKKRGYDFIASLPQTPKIIITSAHKEYALESYEYDVVDYLLKPIQFTRFLKGVQKFFSSCNPGANELMNVKSKNYLYLNTDKKKIKIRHEEIKYIESLRDYIKVFTDNRVVLSKISITQVEGHLGEKNFIRIHRSFLVSKDKITAYSAAEIEIGKIRLPIGRTYKNRVISQLEKY